MIIDVSNFQAIRVSFGNEVIELLQVSRDALLSFSKSLKVVAKNFVSSVCKGLEIISIFASVGAISVEENKYSFRFINSLGFPAIVLESDCVALIILELEVNDVFFWKSIYFVIYGKFLKSDVFNH